MKKPIIITITCLLVASAAIVLWMLSTKAPGGNQGHIRGNSAGLIIVLPAGLAGDKLIPALERSGFERVENKTFDRLVSGEIPERRLVAFRDTTAMPPNQLYLGIGPMEAIHYCEFHEGSHKSAEAWKEHVGKQIERVKTLASAPR